MEVHAPHEAIHSWKDFWIHLGTITIGLLIAIGLEQSVEAVHRVHERRQLQADLRTEASNNRQIIARDLKMEDLEPWFERAEAQVRDGVEREGKVSFAMPAAPCVPGSVGSAAVRYFAPSEAVWTTAAESGLVVLLPVEQGRLYARLAHNYVLLGKSRDQVGAGCDEIAAMQRRFATKVQGMELWTMRPEQAEMLGKTAADTQVSIQGLLFRLRWSDVYEEGILRGENKADEAMMTMNQERFEDQQGR